MGNRVGVLVAVLVLVLVGCGSEPSGYPGQDATYPGQDAGPGDTGTSNPCDNMHCDDGNSCTDDTCVNGTCSFTNNTAECDDESRCTMHDKCAAGRCVGGAPVDCDDKNPCTTEFCNPTGGCTYRDAADGTLCGSQGLQCLSGYCKCSKGVIEICSNGFDDDCNGKADCEDPACDMQGCGTVPNTCYKAGICVSSKCTYAPNTGAACNDNNACTSNDKCDGSGVCSGTMMTCPAPDQCHNAGTCSGGTCSYSVKSGSCDDGNSCTDNDSCQANGECRGTPKACDDGNSCTQDTCSNGVCKHTTLADNTMCLPYNAGNYCSAGVCTPGCVIGNTFYAEGASKNPEGCKYCDKNNPTTWTLLAVGSECRTGTSCYVGSCSVSGTCFTTTVPQPYGTDCSTTSDQRKQCGNGNGTCLPCGGDYQGACAGTTPCDHVNFAKDFGQYSGMCRPCGTTVGQVCCTAMTSCVAGLTCAPNPQDTTTNSCQCGATGQACCGGTTCDDWGIYSCDTTTKVCTCGGLGQKPCKQGTTLVCQATLVLNYKTVRCVDCGADGEPCCPNAAGNLGGVLDYGGCDAGRTCTEVTSIWPREWYCR